LDALFSHRSGTSPTTEPAQPRGERTRESLQSTLSPLLTHLEADIVSPAAARSSSVLVSLRYRLNSGASGLLDAATSRFERVALIIVAIIRRVHRFKLSLNRIVVDVLAAGKPISVKEDRPTLSERSEAVGVGWWVVTWFAFVGLFIGGLYLFVDIID